MYRYKKRVDKALQSLATGYPTILSFIIDGMDQGHCKCPFLGTQESFSHPLKQCITGVKVHGHSVHLYRTLDTVSKGADLTIYCILTEIENFFRLYQRYPEELYVQLDGGSENANQYVLAMLELLVVRRLCRLVYFTRLPVGHTHDDIDACFAIIWKCWMRYQSCETLDMYKEGVESAFREEGGLVGKLFDVVVVPNYQEFLENCIDSKLKRLHKEINTQHQWRFETVIPSQHFPTGCKTTYRAYSSDAVVEFIKKPKDQCISLIGKYTGLEATALTCRWYPSVDCKQSDTTRNGIEGIYLLKKIPFSTSGTITPCALVENSVESIDACLKEVRDRWFGNNNTESETIIESWSRWSQLYRPLSNSVEEYLLQLKRNGINYHIPLKRYIATHIQTLTLDSTVSWGNILKPNSVINTNFKWPEVMVASMNSVVTEFNRHPPQPRLYSITDNELLNDLNLFKEKSEYYYETIISGYLKERIINIIKRRISYTGEVPIIGGTM